MLRARTIQLAETLVRNSQSFDMAAHKTLQMIQEVELVSRGYRLYVNRSGNIPDYRSSALPPITRLEQSSTLRRCSNLRATLSASLTLASSSFQRTALSITPFTTTSLLRQMHQVYNVDDTLPVDVPDSPSLADLKATSLAMHETRRLVLCALLAIHVEPFDAAWSTWRTVIHELSGLTRMLATFTNELTRALEDEQSTISRR
jgi:hypothetical protein